METNSDRYLREDGAVSYGLTPGFRTVETRLLLRMVSVERVCPVFGHKSDRITPVHPSIELSDR